jgi:hypothetical protein
MEQLDRGFTKLKQFAQPRTEKHVKENCELCSAELASDHQHLVEPQTRRLICVCNPCALLFPNQPDRQYRSIPRDVKMLKHFRMTAAQWDSLQIPINLAFFYYHSPVDRVVAIYPSPAGGLESLHELSQWGEIVRDNPVLEKMERDVQALMVNRLGPTYGHPQEEYYLAPIDKCYELVGLIRRHWRGLSGGKAVWREILYFFEPWRKQCSS